MADQAHGSQLPRLSDLARGAQQIVDNLRRIEQALPPTPLRPIEMPATLLTQLVPAVEASATDAAPSPEMPTVEAAPLRAPHRRPLGQSAAGGQSPAQGQASS